MTAYQAWRHAYQYAICRPKYPRTEDGDGYFVAVDDYSIVGASLLFYRLPRGGFFCARNGGILGEYLAPELAAAGEIMR